MRRLRCVLAGLALAVIPLSAQARRALSQPAISPHGRRIAFAAGGDIWTAPARGGEAHLLIASAALNSHPLFSPDGQWLAFESARSGNGDLYLFSFATGRLRRLTWDDGIDSLDSWSPDSQWVYFSSSKNNIGGDNDIYRVRITGGTPQIVTSERYVNEFFAAAAPDGSLAFCARGLASAQWWRDGHAHIDETEIWRVVPATAPEGKNVYTRLLRTGGAKNLWPMFSPDGKTMYFMSDRSGAENLWEVRAGGAPQALTHFTNGRLLWPAIAADGSAIVFERGFGVWRYDVKKRTAAAVALTLVGSPAPEPVAHLNITRVTDLAVSPDGKKLAFTAHGEVFAVGAAKGGEALRITHTGKLQFGLQWSPDNHELAYLSDRDGHDHVYLYDFLTHKERQLTTGNAEDSRIAFSPDGKRLAYQHGIGTIMTVNLASGASTEVARGYFGSLPPLVYGGGIAWSPDGRQIAYLDKAHGVFSNVFVAPAAGGKPLQLSYLANASAGGLVWSPNAKFLLFQTDQRTEPSRIARIALAPEPPVYREDLFQRLFQTPERRPIGGGRGGRGTPAPPATRIVATGIAERLRLLPMLNARTPVISPDGKWLAYVAGANGGGNIYLMSLTRRPSDAPGGRGPNAGAPAPKQLTATTGAKSSLQFTADSKHLFFVQGGQVNEIAVTGGKPRRIAVRAQLRVNFDQEKEEVFAQAWRYLRDTYMNPAMNGVDWDAVRTAFAPEVAGAATDADLRQLLLEMIGRLDSSHSGIYPPPGGNRTATGALGLMFDRVTYETQGKLCAEEVVPLGPAAMAGVKAGDCLEQVDGTAMGAGVNLDRVLDGRIGRKVALRLTGPGGARTVDVQPVSNPADKTLIYNAWVAHNRRVVNRLSGGALGYVHMQDTEQASLDKLYLDLNSTDFSKQGVVIDIRNNNGGFVNPYMLDVLSRQPYLTMVPRGFPAGPARVALGQRALEKPTVLIVNQNSLSDSEDFTEGYEAMHLGQVVGVPTAGWIIFTTAARLLDGSTLRLPTTRILDANGKNMELHRRPVNVRVQNPIGSWQAGQDAQLAAAVKTLLAQIRAAATAKAAGRRP